MTKRRDCGGGRKLGSKDAEKRTRSKATAAKLQSNYEKRATTESASRVVERERKGSPPLVFPRCWEQCCCRTCRCCRRHQCCCVWGCGGPTATTTAPVSAADSTPKGTRRGPSSAAPAAQSQVAEQPACVRLNVRGQSRPQDVYAELADDLSINDDVSSQNAESSVMGCT